jgi:phage repressor protein C with HTH and peptisase S24 domain
LYPDAARLLRVKVSRRWGLAVVKGDSMRPTLVPGDRLLVRYAATAEPGRLVLARFPDGTLAVKRVGHAATLPSGRPGWYLVSDDPAVGIDSRHRGPVPAEDVLAVVRARLWRRPGVVRR